MKFSGLIVVVFLCSGLLAASSCKRKSSGTNSHSNEKPIARVLDEYLYKSDLKNVIPKNLSKKDSSELAQSYVHNWIVQTLLVDKAKQNLPSDKLDFENQIEDYRRSLIIYEYQKEYLKQTQAEDTAISAKEIEDYFNQNKSTFVVENNLLKITSIKIKKRCPEYRQIFYLSRKNDDDSKQKLEELCKKSGSAYSFSPQWLSFNDLLKTLPGNVRIPNQEYYLKTYKTIEATDTANYFLINVLDYKLANDNYPIELVNDKIKGILINKKRIERIKQMEEKIFSAATNEKNINVY